MAILIRAASPTWRLIIVSTSVLGGILLVGGILLAIIGSSAQTTITFFGNKFTSTSIGVAMAFLGAVLVAVTIRRVLQSIDKITENDNPDDSHHGEKAS